MNMAKMIERFALSPKQAEQAWELHRRIKNPIRAEFAVQFVKGLISESEALKATQKIKRRIRRKTIRNASRINYHSEPVYGTISGEEQKGDFYSKGIRLPGSFGKSQK